MQNSEFVIKNMNFLLFSIKFFEDRKDFYIFGKKIFSKPSQKNKTFLIFNTSFFGDVLLCNSLCRNIKNIYPDSKIIFITNKPFYDVAKYQEGVDDVIYYDKKGEHKGLRGMVKFIKNFPYKKAYASFITYRNVRNYTISLLTGTNHIIQSSKTETGLTVQASHTELLKRITNKEVRNLAIKYNVDNSIPKNLWGILSNEKKYIALCTTSKKESKDMHIEKAKSLIAKITEQGYEVVFVGAGQRAEEYASQLKTLGCNFVDLVNKTSIPELAQVLKISKALVSVDTGTMHLGCAVQVPTVVVFYNQEMVVKWAPSPQLYNVKLITTNQTAENIASALFEIINKQSVEV